MDEILSLAIPASFVVMLVLEKLFSGKKLPKVRFWLVKGFLFFVLTGAVNAILPAVLAAGIGNHTLLHLGWLGVVPGALLGFVVSDLVGYWVHRAMHKFPRLWRWTHQMHHSAERMDLAGMSYAHPFDIALSFGLTGAATVLLGLHPDAAALAGFLGYATSVFLHMNIKTPKWMGYVITRPEAHGLHHARGVHAYNYANFAPWDMLFGTFRVTEEFPEEYGFWDGASKKLGSMLIGRDVGQPS